MLYPFVPKRSGVHRIAGIALFRALLTKCRQALPVGHERNIIQNVIRNRFKSSRYVCSKRLLSVAFRGGYEALDLLDAAKAGDSQSISRISELLAKLPERMKRAPPLAPVLPKAQPEPKPPPEPRPSIFSRPYANVSRRRKVPSLVTVDGIPFLRVRKPQPVKLSMYLRARRMTKTKRLTEMQELKHTMLPLARLEDEWDDIIAVEFEDVDDQGPDDDSGMPAWTDAMQDDGITYISNLLDEDSKKNHRMTLKLLEIVKKEKALAETEKKQRTWEKNNARFARRAAMAKEAGEASDSFDLAIRDAGRSKSETQA